MQTAEAGLPTVADYMQLPDDGPRYELIEGELLLAPAPNLFHQRIAFNLTLILGNHVEKKRIEIFRFAQNPERPQQTVRLADSFESKLFPCLTIAAAEVFAD